MVFTPSLVLFKGQEDFQGHFSGLAISPNPKGGSAKPPQVTTWPSPASFAFGTKRMLTNGVKQICFDFADELHMSALPTRMRISPDDTAQDSNVFLRQAEARPQLGVIDVDEPHADTLLARIVSGLNESANESRTGRGKTDRHSRLMMVLEN